MESKRALEPVGTARPVTPFRLHDGAGSQYSTELIFDVDFLTMSRERRRGVMKVCPPCQMVGELLGATLGRYLGLPIPRAYLGKVEAGYAPEIREWPPGGESRVVFLSEEIENTSRTPINEQERLWRLERWPDLPKAVAFDEWMANTDRNDENYLFGLTTRSINLIDFGSSFTSGSWEPEDLNPRQHYENQLFDIAKARFSRATMNKILRAAEKLRVEAHNVIGSDQLRACVRPDVYGGEKYYEAAVSFLRQRAMGIASLLERELTGQRLIHFRPREDG